MASASIRMILLLLPCFIIIIIIHFDDLSAAQSPSGFLSVDCGSAQTTNYTDALGIGWVPDAAIWPDIHGWSSTSEVTPPTDDTSGGAKYQTLRYFPPASSTSPLNQTKFCYTLPAIGDVYYLIRATFWYGTSSTTSLYSTRVAGTISFRVMVDTYTGAQIDIALPQSSPRMEEMYVRAQSGSSSISVCLSAASENSDAPFINALELRPLPSQMTSVAIVNMTNTALRMALRKDYGAAADAPSIIRYPNDTLDRIWETSKTGPANQTSHTVAVAGLADSPPIPVVQTSYAAPTAAGFFVNFTAGLDTTTSYYYYLALFFAEIDPRVNASGLRVFDITINGSPFYRNFDVYANAGQYTVYELYSSKELGPYTDHVLINATSTPSSVYPPFIAAAEILQLFDNPMVPPTSSIDVVGVQGIISALSGNLSRFTGDPCLPADYKYPWLSCTDKDILPTRVTSISLSNSKLVGNVPSSINNLDQVVQILLDGNALEGPLPVDLSNLVNLQVLNLSNNKLSGSIPDSLANLPKLTYLDLQNNNFSGEIPISLQQKSGLTFKYDGNSFLCLSSNKTCAASSSSKSSTSNSSLPAIIGSVVGVIVLCIVISMVITCIVCKRRRGKQHQNQASASSTSPHQFLGPQVVSHTKIFEAANVSQAFTFQEIVTATKNFSTIIGKGGFGFVYKGTLANGVLVAVKVLSDASQQGAHEFLNEVTLLSRVHHKKLVGLVGYCTEIKLVLVYEFMSNGSLFDSLFGNPASMDSRPLEWIERLRILLDAAQGLAYLHHGCNLLIIHRDVKSSNILMSKDLEGKMSDFGISRLKPNTGAHEELATKLMGSMGYLDPEFASTLILSEKIDIYSFGVVLFETICGKPPVLKDSEHSNDIHIVEWAKPYYNQGAIEEVVDQNMGNYNISSIWKVAEIAMACVQFQGRKRPTMNEVCNELSEALRLETSSQTISPAVTGECYPLNDVRAR